MGLEQWGGSGVPQGWQGHGLAASLPSSLGQRHLPVPPAVLGQTEATRGGTAGAQITRCNPGTPGGRRLERTGAAQPPDPSTVARCRSRRAPGRVPLRRAGAGRGPPLQTLTLFSQVRRQFPWKQPGAETGTRIQKREASSSPFALLDSCSRRPRDTLGVGVVPRCGERGAPQAFCSTRGWCRAPGEVPSARAAMWRLGRGLCVEVVPPVCVRCACGHARAPTCALYGYRGGVGARYLLIIRAGVSVTGTWGGAQPCPCPNVPRT